MSFIELLQALLDRFRLNQISKIDCTIADHPCLDSHQSFDLVLKKVACEQFYAGDSNNVVASSSEDYLKVF